MSSYVKVNDNLFIAEQSVTSEKMVETRQNVNHIWIYDRSWSMSGELSDLTNQLIVLSKGIPKDDTITIGWFSGEGDYNFILKGFKINSDVDYVTLESAIRKNSSPVSCTCFSEILEDVNTVVDDLSIFSDVFSLHFFTDGYPIVSDYKTEIDNIFKAIDSISGKMTTAMLVGYGNYYNKELMNTMAEKLGAMLIHSSMMSEYAGSVSNLLELSGSTSPKQKVIPIVSDAMAVFTVTDQGVVLYNINEDGVLYMSPASDGSETTIFYITNTKPDVETATIPGLGEDFIWLTWFSGFYGGAFVMTQQTKTDIALELMGSIGDKAMVDVITNAFTIEEYGKVEATISNAIYDETQRFVNGRDINYLPPVDAFCVFDALTVLMGDDDAYFFPYSKDFKYNRVGKKSVPNDEYSKFEAVDDVKCKFTDLVWHQSRLNLSVRTTVSGLIVLKDKDGKSAADMGFADKYPVFVWRNYTFVKDGIVNVKRVRISTSESTFQYFNDNGVVIQCDGVSADSYVLDLSNIPSINRALAEGNTSAKSLAELVGKEKKLQGILKAFKWYLKTDFPESEIEKDSPFTDVQMEFLKANGVDATKGGVFSPKVEYVDSGDFYVAKKFEIKVKKVSSLPAVPKVLEKVRNDKKRTLSESLLEPAIDSYNSIQTTIKDHKLLAGWLESEIDKANGELKSIRQSIQKSKLAIIMGKKWFDEFDSRDETSIDTDEFSFEFKLGEETVNI